MILLRILIVIGICWLGAVLIFPDPSGPLFLALHLLPIASVCVVAYGCFVSYERPQAVSSWFRQGDPVRWLVAMLSWLPVVLFLGKIVLFHAQVIPIDRTTLLISVVADLSLFSVLYLSLLSHFHPTLHALSAERRVLIIGSGNRARRLAATFSRSKKARTYIVGYLDPDPTRVNRSVLGYRVLGTIDDISVVLKDQVIDEVIMAVPRGMIADVEKIARTCEEEGVKFCVMADLFEVPAARTRLVEFGQIPVLTHEPVAQSEWRLLVKRGLDLAVTVALLPVVLPLMGAIAVAIKLDSPGPVFFLQERVGLKKRRFRMLKFRSMVKNADALQHDVEHLNEAQGPIFKIVNDPRITRVGRLLRRTSLDELPQILHVLTGQMSLVGPRPMSLRDVAKFDEGVQRKRFSVKPGLTCLWQISGRSNLPFSKWLELDLKYIQEWSLRLDLKILLKTLPAVLKGDGAV
ncbi:MAG: sugar transferase [Candidatus Binatia bacterium]